MSGKRVICAGSGLAALNFALHTDKDTEVLIIAADEFNNSNSFMAKGGVAVPTSDCDIEQHIRDTITAGDEMCNADAVEDIITNGIKLAADMKKGGFLFDETLGKEGGHSTHRILHVGDETGKHLVNHIAEKVKQRTNIRVLQHCCLLELYVEHGICKGALIGNTLSHSAEWIYADAVVLATGGCGNLYRNNTNSSLANGEGYAVAFRAGAALSGMEFMQFHPTMLLPDNHHTNFLVTEAFRGAGAVLKDMDMHELMKDVHPMGSLAPRDIVSRTIFRYLQQKNVPAVWLDFSVVNMDFFKKEFPALYRICEQSGFLPAAKIPVTPAAHYMCGGVKTNLFAETDISKLYAIGEVACTGLHGANRLASNSLLELLIMSERAALQINMLKSEAKNKTIKCKTSAVNLDAKLNAIQSDLQSVMWSGAGIIRNEKGMKNAVERLHISEQELLSLYDDALIHIGLKQLLNRVQTALLIAESALKRKENRGCHFREDE